MVIVTSGSKYIDIDAYAGCIAYANLLNLKGIKAKAVSTATYNESITKSLMNLNIKLDEYEENENNEFVIVDVSNKEYFDNIVKEDSIIEVIDHHVGYEGYWKRRLDENAKIEFIGSVATIIVEEYENANCLSKMSKDIAILLMSAILDNTLNFKAKITTNRDKIAYKKLQDIAKTKENYAEEYFLECQLKIEENLKYSIENDTKVEEINTILPIVFGQLIIWNNIISEKNNKKIMYDTLNNIGNDWMINIVCLAEGKSYIIAPNIKTQNNLERLFNKHFENDIMQLDDVYLRKEIIKISSN